MSAAEETIKEQAGRVSQSKIASLLDRALSFISSVRFGVVQLCILVLLSLVGMLIIQQNVNGFDAYFASLTPAEKIVYGSLGLFDIYHSWYFLFLLLLVSLNIVLASIDHFPTAKTYITKPKLSATRGWLLGQKQNAVLQIRGETKQAVAENISRVFKQNGLSARTAESSNLSYAFDKKGNKNYSEIINKTNLYVYGESGRWNRMGA